MSETDGPFTTREKPAPSAAAVREPSIRADRDELIREFLLKQSEVQIMRSLNPHREGRPYLPLIGPAA